MRNKLHYSRVVAFKFLLMALGVDAAGQGTFTWDNGGAGNGWATPANWSSNIRPPTGGGPSLRLIFPGAVSITSTNNLLGTLMVEDLIFSDPFDSIFGVIDGNPLQLSGGTPSLALVAGDPSSIAIRNNLVVATSTEVTVPDHSGGANSSMNLDGNLTGNRDLVKKGGGLLSLSGSNGSWTGNLVIDDGEVLALPGNVLGNSTGVNLRGANGVIDFTAEGEDFGGLRGQGTVILDASVARSNSDGSSTVFTGVIRSTTGQPGTGNFEATVGSLTLAGNARVQDLNRLRARNTGDLIVRDTAQVDAAIIDAINSGALLFTGDAVVEAGQLVAPADASRIEVAGNARVSVESASIANDLFVTGGRFETRVFNGPGDIEFQGGAVSPGGPSNTTAVLQINDADVNQSGGKLVLDIFGPNIGNDRDFVDLDNGEYRINGGGLELNTVGYTPEPYELFQQIITADLVTAPFHFVEGVEINADLSWAVQYGLNFVLMQAVLPGDGNRNQLVEQGDLDLVLSNWGDSRANGDDVRWITGDYNGSGQIEQGDLDAVLANWGKSVPVSAPAVVVPEPAAVAGWFSVVLLCAARRRRVGSRQRDGALIGPHHSSPGTPSSPSKEHG